MRQRHLAAGLGHHAAPAAGEPPGLSGPDLPEPLPGPLAGKAGTEAGAGLEVLLEELEDCAAAPSAEEVSESREIVRCIDRWLAGLPEDDRTAFLRRYWFGLSVKELARQESCAPQRMTQRLYRLRQSLRKALEEEGIDL